MTSALRLSHVEGPGPGQFIARVTQVGAVIVVDIDNEAIPTFELRLVLEYCGESSEQGTVHVQRTDDPERVMSYSAVERAFVHIQLSSQKDVGFSMELVFEMPGECSCERSCSEHGS